MMQIELFLYDTGWPAGENGGLVKRRVASALLGIRGEVGAKVRTNPDYLP